MALPKRIHEQDLSSWSKDQEKLIKKALLEYKGRSPRSRGLGWSDIQRDVEDATGVSMGGKDHFRQYIAGTRPATDDDDRRRAIVMFLTDPDVDILSLEEFLEPDSRFHAPRRLLEYLRTDLQPVDAPDPLDRLIGVYRTQGNAGERALKVELELWRVEGDAGVLRIIERREEGLFQTLGTNLSNPEAQITSSGWCVLTPEDNLLFFLKGDCYGENHYYHLASDADLWSERACKQLSLLRYDYPELAGSNEQIADSLAGSVHTFFRMIHN